MGEYICDKKTQKTKYELVMEEYSNNLGSSIFNESYVFGHINNNELFVNGETIIKKR